MGQKVNPHGLRVGVIKDWARPADHHHAPRP
ncbi:protein containing Ribosomal protein S3, partial [human gut metagenome]